MSDNRFRKNKDDATGEIFLNETVGPEHYNRHMRQNQAKPSKRANYPLFADEDEIPAYNLAEEDNDEYEEYDYSDSNNVYFGNRYQQKYQPQYQQPQYQQPQYPQYQPQYPEQPKKKKKKKKHRLLKALIITPLVTVFTVLIAVVALAYGLLSSIDYTQVDLEENQYIDSSELHHSSDVTNILFIGADDSSGGNSRSDSMMLISIDNKHKKIKLTSFLRDSWVEIPSKGKKAKLNAAFAYGGAQLTVDTLEYNFLIDIDHYVLVDFEMFTEIIDAVGGVEVEVTENEAKFIRNTTRFKEMESGEKVRLSGAEALVYCRIRKLDSDYMRTYRQRKVITALMEQAKEAEIKTLIDAIYDVFPLIQTDLDKKEILTLGIKGGYGLLAYEIQQTRAPIEEHMQADTINGQWVEVLELDKVREYLYDYIYTDKIKFDDDKKEED